MASAAVLVFGCNGGTGAGCDIVDGPRALPGELSESSGVAPSRRTPGLYWTHSDDTGPAVLWAIRADGAVVGSVALETARSDPLRVYDAEDIASGPCGSESCLYLADVGDNRSERDTLYVLRIPEPDPAGGRARAEPIPVRLPDGPRDIESIFVLPDETLFLVTKGREQPVAVYRHPGPLRPDTVVTLEQVQLLSETPRVLPRQVTGASAAPDGALIVLRTYETLLFQRWDGGRLVPVAGGVVNLRSLREAQGEGVGIAEDGTVVLTSEGGPARAAGSITLLRCRFDAEG